MAEGRSGSGTSFVLGVVFTLVVLVGGAWVYLKYGKPPVATADPAFPMEAQIVHVPMDARIAREQQTAPFAASPAVYLAGAQVYKESCASCHGLPGKSVPYAKYMYPQAPQLWTSHRGGVVGVSDDEAGETFWKVKNGLRLTGMPAYQHVLSEEQMWDVSLLLKGADQPMPDAVKAVLAPAQP